MYSEDLAEALQRIQQWTEAYPLDIFPEPDLKRAAELLKAGGITLDSISAHCMRHALDGVGDVCRKALGAQPSPTELVTVRDGFVGTIIGDYRTREGELGIVLQQQGTKVVHVYRTASVVSCETVPKDRDS